MALETSKFKMFQGIRNDRKSNETSGVTGESDWSSFLIPCTFLGNGIIPGANRPSHVARREHIPQYKK